MFYMLLFSVVLLAYANGANDNFKGVASLYGSKTTGYKTALTWATITTFLGSVTSFFLAGKLLKAFSGKGLVPPEILQSPEFILAVILGAACTVLLATRFQFPISTTHSLVGALTGAGLMASFSELNLAQVTHAFLIPLLVAPLLALLLSYLAYQAAHFYRKKWDVGPTDDVRFNENASYKINSLHKTATVAISHYSAKTENILTKSHFLSSGIVSFARGLNDTPKIAALLMLSGGIEKELSLLIIGGFMAIGGWLHSKQIAKKISLDITEMNHGQGFIANIVSGFLVIFASKFGVPVSTTHVTVGSIFGIGIVSGKAQYAIISTIVLSWMLTLPVAILLSAGFYFVAY